MTTLDDTVKTAKNVIDETRDNAGHAVVRARSTLLDGLHAAASTLTMIRGLGLGDALGWVGLERRRGPFMPTMTFGAGFLAGAAAGVLFAPMSGVDTRRWLIGRAMGMEQKAEKTVTEAQTKVADKAGEIADLAKDKAGEIADKAKGAVHMAEDKASELADKAKGAVHMAEDKTNELADKARANGGPTREGTKPSAAGAAPNHRTS
jgi:gas vesicle protein